MQRVPSIHIQSPRATRLSTISIGARLGGSGSATADSTGAELAAPGERDYRPGLATSELVAEIHVLLATERWAERLVCRYLADLADRIQARQHAELGGYDDELQATRCFFGLSARDTRERVRVGRALRKLPRIERAFMDGELSYSRVREVTRVATAPSEPDWLEFARGLDMRSLERRVAAEREAAGEKSERDDERRPGERSRTQWMGADRVRVTFELSTEAWTLLERAMREARRAGVAGPGDGDAVEAVAQAALSLLRGDPRDAGDAARPHRWSNRGGSVEDRSAVELERSIAEGRRERGEATRGGMPSELGTEATQSGSAAERVPDRRIDDRPVGIGTTEQAGELGRHLLGVMGHSRGWTLDALSEASGLSAQQVCVTLTLLELAGRVRQRAFALDPV